MMTIIYLKSIYLNHYTKNTGTSTLAVLCDWSRSSLNTSPHGLRACLKPQTAEVGRKPLYFLNKLAEA